MTPDPKRKKLNKALVAWANWYQKRLERIQAGSQEDYTGQEQDLFEAYSEVIRGAIEKKPTRS